LCCWRTRGSSCADLFCAMGFSDWVGAHYVCEGDCGPRAGVARFSKGVGLRDWLWTDCVQSGRFVFGLSTCGCCGGGGNDQPVCTSCLVSCDSGCTEDAIALDGVSYFMGDRGWGVGG